MRIDRLRLRNWCQHQDVEVVFSPNLNIIRGPIGSGKTNLLNGLVYAVTGDLSRLPGVKADNIRQPQATGRSFVEVDFTHGATSARISRDLKSSRPELFVNGNQVANRVEEINCEMLKLLGVSNKLLLDYVFVPQWGIFSFIDQQQSVRAKAFGDLFGASQAEEIYKALTEHDLEIPVPPADLDKIGERMEKHRRLLDGYHVRLAQLADVPDNLDLSTDPRQLVVQSYNQRVSLLDKLHECDAKLAVAMKRRHTSLNRLHTAVLCLRNLEQLVAECHPAVEAAVADMEKWRLYEFFEATRKNYLTSIENTTTALQQITLPAEPDNYIPNWRQSEENQELQKLEHEHAQLEKLVANLLSSSSAGQCPTCGTPAEELVARLMFYQERLAHIEAIIMENSVQLSNSASYDDEYAQCEMEIANLHKELANFADSLSRLNVADKPARDKEEIQRIITDNKTVTDDLKQHESVVNALRSEADLASAEVEWLSDQNAAIVCELGSIAEVTTADANAAAKQLNELSKRMSDKFAVVACINSCQNLLKDDEELTARCRDAVRDANKIRRLNEHIEEVRRAMRELPRVVSQACLIAIRDEVNSVLDSFDARFRVASVDELSFMLRFSDSKIMPAERLSGGERVLFALAFRIVINSKFAGELGLLCLDEPTPGLDEGSRHCLEVALERLREMSHARGLQVLLVTHDAGLDGLFDKVIDLKTAL